MLLVEKALEFATRAHAKQVRKISKQPYINHPIRVAEILKNAGFNEIVITAGILHDTVEDTSVTIEDILMHFGKEVAALVASHTEDKTKSWEERKLETIQTVKTGPIEVKALIAADKYENLQSLIYDYQTIGDDIWNYFNRGFEKQRWYHISIANNLLFGLQLIDVPPFFNQFIKECNSFFG